MSNLKRVLKHPETKVGFAPLDAKSDELAQLLEQAIATRAKCDVSGTTGQVKILGDSTTESIDFPLAQPLAQTPSELLAIIFLTRSTLLCIQSSNVEAQESRLSLKAPFRAFKLQRRGGVRVDLTGAYEYLAEVHVGANAPAISRILDLSALGMSILVPAEQSKRFEKGRRVDRITFRVDGKQITVDAKVTYQAAYQFRSLEGIRVGLKFGKVRADDAELISLLMARHLVQY